LNNDFINLQNKYQETITLTEDDKSKINNLRSEIVDLNAFIAKLKKEKIELEKKLKYQPKRIIIPNELEQKVFFKTGSAVIRKEFYEILNRYAEDIKYQLRIKAYNHIQIEGHTDIVPINRACLNDNWDLGAARAIAVVRYFINKGINPKYFSAASYSKFHPIDPNDTEAARKLNRRIEIVLQKK